MSAELLRVRDEATGELQESQIKLEELGQKYKAAHSAWQKQAAELTEMQTSCAIADRTCRIQEAATDAAILVLSKLQSAPAAAGTAEKEDFAQVIQAADDRAIRAESDLRSALEKLSIRESELDDVMSDLRNS